jgi:glycosyltransferase involved in cell wall biosynthesis
VLCDPAEGRGRCPECYRRYDFWGDVPWRRSVMAALVGNVHAFISPSQALVELHVRSGYDRRRFRVIKNGLVTRMPATLTHPGVRRLVSTQGEYNTLVFAGGGIEIKGVGILLRALPMLVRYVERLRVVVAGRGELGYLAQLRHCAPTVDLLGLVPYTEMPALYAAGELTLAISTVYESLSMVTLQSLQVGTPVVGSSIGGIPELVRDEETGYLVRHDDPTALAEKIILHFARAPFERRQMRQRCAAYAAEHFDYDQHLDAVSQVYRQAVGSA